MPSSHTCLWLDGLIPILNMQKSDGLEGGLWNSTYFKWKIGNMWLLARCYDRKMVKSPRCPSVGLTNNNNKKTIWIGLKIGHQHMCIIQMITLFSILPFFEVSSRTTHKLCNAMTGTGLAMVVCKSRMDIFCLGLEIDIQVAQVVQSHKKLCTQINCYQFC